MIKLVPFLRGALLASLALLGALAAPASAQTERVAAVVNEEVITLHDLDARMRMVILSSNLPDTQESKQRIVGQVMRRLIDERLQLQEAAKQKVNISANEIMNGINTIERQNNMPRGAMIPFLKNKGIDPETLRQQVKAELAWVRVVRRELVPNVRIGEEEIDTRLETLKENLGKPEYLAAEIFLGVEDPSKEAEVQSLAMRLLDQMRQGAPFSSLARQFSQSGAASGGDLGWVTQGMMDDELMTALSALQPGQTTQPLHLSDGYHILLLRDKRIAGQVTQTEPTLDMAQVFLNALPSATMAEREAQAKAFEESLAGVSGCDEVEKKVKHVPAADWTHPGKTMPSQLPAEIAAMTDNLKPGQLSKALVQDNVRRYFLVCGRTEPKGGLPSRDDIRQKLEDERVNLGAQRYMRDLRRAAFVEIRI